MIKPVCLVLFIFICIVVCENKYSRDANEKQNKNIDFRTLEKPFRRVKLNLLWKKAQQRLTEPKLKSLFSELKVQDKEEMTLKVVQTEGGDKEGLKEAELRRKLTNIMTNYNLREHFEDYPPTKPKRSDSLSDHHLNKSLFKDKKLNMLWQKAETSGFTSEELLALKEEFKHHQDKIDQYYDLLNNVDLGKSERDDYRNALDEDNMERFNEIRVDDDIDRNFDKELSDQANLVREKHRGLRDGYDKLQRLTAKGPNNKEFVEPKVQGLWKIAAEANFTVDELASLKVELLHYENRLLKLRYLHADQVSNVDKHRSKVAASGNKMDHFDEQQQMIKKHTRKMEKMHADLESKILTRHNEL